MSPNFLANLHIIYIKPKHSGQFLSLCAEKGKKIISPSPRVQKDKHRRRLKDDEEPKKKRAFLPP